MGKRERLSGNEAVAIALRQINPDVFPAFPITPSTEIPQYFAGFVANGEVEYVVTRGEELAHNNYTCISTAEFIWNGSNVTYYLYQRA